MINDNNNNDNNNNNNTNNNNNKIFPELNGKTKQSNEIPDVDQTWVFWSDIWSKSKEHNRKAEWQKKLKKENIYQK